VQNRDFDIGENTVTKTRPKCAYCERDSEQVPLLALHYQETEAWICPQHLPVLIHDPAQLAGKLPGVENLGPPEEHHH
jgi:hypothetical protein